jgi:hypothetical protein
MLGAIFLAETLAPEACSGYCQQSNESIEGGWSMKLTSTRQGMSGGAVFLVKGSRMRFRALVAALACVGALVVVVTSASAHRPTQVVCWFLGHRGLNGWHEQVRPSGGCALHRAHHGQRSWIYLTSHTHWTRWSPHRATGRVPYRNGTELKLTLYRPREGWTPKGNANYFSRLRFRSGARRSTWRLDVPQHRQISFR